MSEFWRDRRVLITGGSGFLGAWLSRLLLAAGARVDAFDLSEGVCLAAHNLEYRVPVILGNVLDQPAVERALRAHSIEVCFHLAGQSLIDGAAAGPVAAFDLNVRGTWTVLEASRRVGTLRAVVCASSNHIYGPQRLVPFTEDCPLNQLDVYGASKACADLLTRSYAKSFGLPAVAVRNVNTFGPGDPHTSHIVTGTILSLLKGDPPVIRGDGTSVKAYLQATDTMTAYMLLAEHAERPEVRGEAFNVTPPTPISVAELVQAIITISGQEVAPVVTATDLSQQGDAEHLSGDKIKRLLGWTPHLSLEAGLRNTYHWYAKHGMAWIWPGTHG